MQEPASEKKDDSVILSLLSYNDCGFVPSELQCIEPWQPSPTKMETISAVDSYKYADVPTDKWHDFYSSGRPVRQNSF